MTSTILLSPPLTELAGLARVQARLSPAYTAAGVQATGTITSNATTDTIDITFLGDIVLPCAVEVISVTQTLSSAV